MSSNQPWLQRLSEATDYRELQTIFSQLASEVSHSSDNQQLVASIDEAIARVEQERARDADELQEFEARYAEFRTQEAGLLGWFRRHIPFTQTRQQERQHKETISDQQAEILADNLVIARAQMLKQKLLPPEQRQLGHSLPRWEAQLAACQSMDRIADYARVIENLSEEIGVSKEFVNKIRGDIDAFDHARFTNKEDRQLQETDTQQARQELAEFESELSQERNLKQTAIKRAGEFVHQDLMLSHHQYYQLDQRLHQLQSGHHHGKKTSQQASEFAERLNELQKLSASTEGCAEERERLRVDDERLREQLQSTRQQLDKLERKMAKHTRSATDDPSDNDQNKHASFKSKYDRCRQEQQDIEQQLRQNADSQKQNDAEESRLAAEFQIATEKLPQALAEFEPLLNVYLQSIEPLSIQSHVESLHRTMQWSMPASRGEDAARRIQQLAEAIDNDCQELIRQASQTQAERNQIYADHCINHLGQKVGEWVTRSQKS